MDSHVFFPGDILFYTALAGDIEDTVIVNWTGSQIVHVAVAISAMQKIEALNNGVMLDPLNPQGVASYWSYRGNVDEAHQAGLPDALLWLQKQVGQLYGYGDLVNAVLWKYEHGLVIDTGHFDCSALASEFLLKAGGVHQLASVTDPHVITPASLAQLLGVK